MKNAYLVPLLDQVDKSTARAQDEFGHLSAAQLNWKRNPESWSIGQCLDHLITSNSTYFPQFRAIGDGSASQGFWAKVSPFSGFFGNMLLKGTGPDLKQKMKSPKPFAPTQGNVDAGIVSRFLAHQAELKQLLAGLDRIDNAGFKIPSPAAGIITYRLDAAVQIIVQHEVRHLNQAKRVMEEPGFPKG